MRTLTTMGTTMVKIGTIAALVGALAGCRGMSQEATEPVDTVANVVKRDSNCRHTADRYQRITICQLADRERWITTPHQRFGRLEETTTDIFPHGHAVVYKSDEVWEYSREGVTMTDGLGNRYRMVAKDK